MIRLDAGFATPEIVIEMQTAGYTREVKGTIAEITKNGEIQISYPKWADINISFDERIAVFRDSYIFNNLQLIFEIIELQYKVQVITETSYIKIEEKLINESRMLLSLLAQTYGLSTIEEKEQIIEQIRQESNI